MQGARSGVMRERRARVAAIEYHAGVGCMERAIEGIQALGGYDAPVLLSNYFQ